MTDRLPTSMSGAQPPSGSSEEKLLDLLDRWQDAFEKGREIEVAELCRDCPELATEMQRRIDVLWMMDKLATSGDAATPKPSDGMTLQPPDAEREDQ